MRVVDADGEAWIRLSTDVHLIHRSVLQPTSGVFIGYNGNSGNVAVHGENEKSGASLGITEHGGVVTAFGKDGKSGVEISVDEHGGIVDTYGKDGKSKAMLGITEHGSISTWDTNGYRQ